ncbi:MAG: hypothetical protein J6O04_00355 [Selenomonadaceae bacterium]|nr:hypothetical protein [Selenomonadaceae bacterium]
MKHAINISLSKEHESHGIIACRQTSIRERLLRFFLGNPVKLTLIVPGDSVDEVTIREVAGGDDATESNMSYAD